MHDAGDVFRQEILRDAFRQYGRQAERILDVGQIIDLLGHGLFGDVAVERHERDHHVALAELGIHFLLGLVYRRTGRIGYRLVAVGEVRHALCDVARDDEDEHDDEDDVADLVGEFAEAAALFGDERAVLGLGDDVLRAQDERGHEQQHSQQAERDALCQHEAHIRADAEVHQRHGRKADDGRHAGGADGRERGAPCVRHRLFGLRAGGALLREGVQQEDGVVHRAGQLQYRADRVGQERDLTEDDVRAHVEQDRDAEHGQEQHRLEPRGRGDGQDDEDDDDRQRHNAGNLRVDGRAEVGIRHGGACHQTSVADDALDLVYGLVGLVGRVLVGEDNIHIGLVILVVVIDVGVVDEFARAVDIGGHIAPHDHVHAVHIRDAVLYALRFIQRDVLQHDTAHAGVSKFVLHNVERLRGRGRVRQIFCQVVVDADHRHTDQTEDDKYNINLFDQFAVVNDQIDWAVSFKFHKENTIFLRNRYCVGFLFVL